MIPVKLANTDAHQISVTTTAASLLDLIETAGSTAHGLKGEVNAVDLVVEDGDIRYLQDNTPTTAKGMLVKEGQHIFLRQVNLNTLNLISTSGTVSVGVSVGISEPGEVSN